MNPDDPGPEGSFWHQEVDPVPRIHRWAWLPSVAVLALIAAMAASLFRG